MLALLLPLFFLTFAAAFAGVVASTTFGFGGGAGSAVVLSFLCVVFGAFASMLGWTTFDFGGRRLCLWCSSCWCWCCCLFYVRLVLLCFVGQLFGCICRFSFACLCRLGCCGCNCWLGFTCICWLRTCFFRCCKQMPKCLLEFLPEAFDFTLNLLLALALGATSVKGSPVHHQLYTPYRLAYK